ELATRGFVRTSDPGRAGFLVDYKLASGPLVQTIVNPTPAASYYGASSPVYTPPLPVATTYTYAESRLLLDFGDARTGAVFWRGVAAFGTERPIEASTSKATKAVGKILRKYPAPQLARTTRPAG